MIISRYRGLYYRNIVRKTLISVLMGVMLRTDR